MTEAFVETDAFIGKVFLGVGDGDSPEMYGRYCEITDFGDFGEKKNDLVDVTTFCSNGVKQYIAGLSEGQEFDFSANFTQGAEDSPSRAVQTQLINGVTNKKTLNFTLSIGDNSPLTDVWSFSLSMLSWAFAPSLSKQNMIKFTGKITGPIVMTTSA